MSKVVGMVPITKRRRLPPVSRPRCTACGAPLIDALAVIAGQLRTDALACSACGRLGVACQCKRLAA